MFLGVFRDNQIKSTLHTLAKEGTGLFSKRMMHHGQGSFRTLICAPFAGRRKDDRRSYFVYNFPGKRGLDTNLFAAEIGSFQKKSKIWSPSITAQHNTHHTKTPEYI
jgi:hypothetical protein